jgi:hypothetical protein
MYFKRLPIPLGEQFSTDCEQAPRLLTPLPQTSSAAALPFQSICVCCDERDSSRRAALGENAYTSFDPPACNG